MGTTMNANDAPVETPPDFVSPVVFTDAEPDPIHACKILIIDDEEPNVRLLERTLARAGFDNFISTTDSREAAMLFAEFQPDLVLTDWLMPDFDGCAVIEQMRALMATDDYLPIIVLTADITPHTRQRALGAGATDFLTKPFDQIEIRLRIQNLLKARLSHLTVQKQNASLEESVRHRTIELEHTLAELKHTQQQVIQQERLAALGTMAGGIAHDFNNALSVIMGFGELLLHAEEKGMTKEKGILALNAMLTAAADASQTVHRLREFYRPDDGDERLPVDLNHLIEQAISLTQPRWQTVVIAGGHTIRIVNAPGNIPCVSADAAELREALTNLIFNSVDALPLGGTITFSTRHDDRFVVLSISDTGVGMSEEVRQRCLEPFFTTKGKRGTGLGLSMVFGIIQRHGGVVAIDSKLGEGTNFILRLPISEVEDAPRPDALPGLVAPLRILVVDDQPILCQLLCDQLQSDLHTVETAQSGSIALEKFRAAHFDLVITDHVMSGMTGEQLALRMKEIHPETPVILLTGYPGEANAGKKCGGIIDLVLQKPLSRAALRHAMAEVMMVGEH